VFFAFVIDAFSRRVVGWQLASHMRTTLVLDALRMALGQRAPGADLALVHHSDRGSQYTSIDYTQTLTDHGVLASVGSVGHAYDNALAESFVDSFKTRAHRRPRLAHPVTTRAGRRGVRRLVQRQPPPSEPRRPSAGRGGDPLRNSRTSDSLSQSMKRGTQQTRSPSNLVRLTQPTASKTPSTTPTTPKRPPPLKRCGSQVRPPAGRTHPRSFADRRHELGTGSDACLVRSASDRLPRGDASSHRRRAS
jgi:hypothetical protein